MIWVAWRQHRLALLASMAYVLLGIAAMTYLRFDMLSYVERNGRDLFGDHFHSAAVAARIGLAAFPVLVGVFVGAPMFAREWERQTHLVGLGQSVGRVRWVLTKLGVVALPAVLGAGLLDVTYIWLSRSLGRQLGDHSRIIPNLFEFNGIVLISYTLFALVLGAVVGLLLRHSVPAMVLTLATGSGVGLLVREVLRPRYLPPVHTVTPLTLDNEFGGALWMGDPTAWTLSKGPADVHGVSMPVEGYHSCLPAHNPRGDEGQAITSCLARNGVSGWGQSFQPGDRFWTFQLIESGLFLGLSAALLAVGLWWLNRRLR